MAKPSDPPLTPLARKRKRKIARRIKLINSLKDKPCADCNQSLPLNQMSFDHRDKTIKEFNIGGQKGKTVGLPRLMIELAKCDVVCLKCHKLREERRDGVVLVEAVPNQKKAITVGSLDGAILRTVTLLNIARSTAYSNPSDIDQIRNSVNEAFEMLSQLHNKLKGSNDSKVVIHDYEGDPGCTVVRSFVERALLDLSQSTAPTE